VIRNRLRHDAPIAAVRCVKFRPSRDTRSGQSHSFQLIELHSNPASQGLMQDIELARISQRVLERPNNLLAVRKGAR
jgi:hypothetical protein